MGWENEAVIDYYYGKYKRNGLFEKQHAIELFIFPSYIKGSAFACCDRQLSDESFTFKIFYEAINRMYIGEINNDDNLTIEYKERTSIVNTVSTIVFLGIENPQEWIRKIEVAKEKHFEKVNKENAERKRQQQLEVQKEEEALQFYTECYDCHIKKTTPVYKFFLEKNKTIVLFIDKNKGLNFLKIDGYAKEENVGIISYDNIHYYEKAGNVHYTTDVHGEYSSFGGSMAGGNFSKLAAVGGGLLFGLMGMAAGTSLTYKPAEQKPVETKFSISSDVRTIDDRNIILNFYSDIKGQYIDIELPYDIFNFLSTHLPEKKYGIVDELEKRTAIHQSAKIIERGDLLNSPMQQNIQRVDEKNEDSDTAFEQKVRKLKMMKDAGLLTDEEFDSKRKELLDMI